jgi:phage tail sheath protein FI
MPEYLAPGVYVEETSFRAKTIEGVGTSTAGFVGPARTGPISGHPELLTSFADFVRIYGGLDDLNLGGPVVNFLAHGVRAFFEEGGARCYVMRVFNRGDGDAPPDIATFHASAPLGNAEGSPIVQARFPGQAGNLRVTFRIGVGRNVLLTSQVNGQAVKRLSRVSSGDVVIGGNDFFIVRGSGTAVDPWAFAPTATPDMENPAVLSAFAGDKLYPISVVVDIEKPRPDGGFESPETLGEFSLNGNSSTSFLKTFVKQPGTRFAALTIPFMFPTPVTDIGAFLKLLFTGIDLSTINENTKAENLPRRTLSMIGGTDGAAPTAQNYDGVEDNYADLIAEDDFTKAKNGLLAFEAIPDIHIVAAPGHTAWHDDEEDGFAIGATLTSHCEKMKYRIAVLETPENNLVTQALGFRNLRSSKYAAIYYPWIYVADPRPGRGTQRLKLPPSGFVAGIYARNDIEHAVFKAPANEVVRLAVDFEYRLSKAHQELLNPNGVNCFRFFEGRGMLLWGARTVSDDPEWKYVNLRRYFAYLEQSIDRGTQWAVFENNSEPLWANIRRTIEDFLYNEWRRGGLLGEKPEKAYFVRCDRSTMTQNDLDNGRLVCLIGVAPVKPAEFVIFRIGQWTADSPNT